MNPLKILSLPVGSSLEDAKKRWWQLSQQSHPDHNPDNPEAAQRFIEVTNAYDALKNNPALLNGNVTHSESRYRTVVIALHVPIKDIYFGKEFPIKIDRCVLCSSCSGTGSRQKKAGYCTHCEGLGKISSSVLSLLNRSPICPVCNGVGIPEENLCLACGGSKYEDDKSVRKIRVSVNDYHKGTIILKNAGHQNIDGSFGNAFIKLSYEYDNKTFIENEYFNIYEKILPVQRIIGDTAETTLFGRIIRYPIKKNDSEVYIKDEVKPGVTQHIRIRYLETPPVITEDTLELYNKILEIEKQTSL
jgi:DnaJ homolog subfamily A member 2